MNNLSFLILEVVKLSFEVVNKSARKALPQSSPGRESPENAVNVAITSSAVLFLK